MGLGVAVALPPVWVLVEVLPVVSSKVKSIQLRSGSTSAAKVGEA